MFEGAQGFFDRNIIVVIMGLIQIDAVDLQSLQRTLHSLDDVPPGKPLVIRPRTHAPGHLRCQQYLITPGRGLQPAADERLGSLATDTVAQNRVDIRGVDQVTARFDIGIEQAA
ncbi:hypothetical protein D3C81_1269890 [compost metagenome]